LDLHQWWRSNGQNKGNKTDKKRKKKVLVRFLKYYYILIFNFYIYIYINYLLLLLLLLLWTSLVEFLRALFTIIPRAELSIDMFRLFSSFIKRVKKKCSSSVRLINEPIPSRALSSRVRVCSRVALLPCSPNYRVNPFGQWVDPYI
jgi:hypothetical protein